MKNREGKCYWDRIFSDPNSKKEDTVIARKTELTKEVFLSTAKSLGWDTKDPHMEELFTYVREVLQNLRGVGELDLTGIEPVMPFVSSGK